MIEIKGQNGRITSKGYYKFCGECQQTCWEWERVGDITAAIDGTQLETQISAEVRDSRVVDVYFMTTDWRGNTDYSDDDIAVIVSSEPPDEGSSLSPDTPVRNAPEFTHVVIPLCCMVMMYTVFRRKKREAIESKEGAL